MAITNPLFNPAMISTLGDLAKKSDNPWGKPLGAAASAAAGGAAAAKTGLNPLSILVPLGFQLLSGLFGGDDEEEQRMMEERRFDKIFALLKNLMGGQAQTRALADAANPAVLQALLNNMNRYSNWGWPEGMRVDNSMLASLLQNFPSVASSASSSPIRRRTD